MRVLALQVDAALEGWESVTWIAIDGEGLGRAPHRYVMMCRSDGSGDEDYIEDVNGLATATCLNWLLQLSRARHDQESTHICGYYLSYDWTMILKDLPNKTLYRLLRPELRSRQGDDGGGFSPVTWRGFRLHYLSRMMRISRGSRSVTVWDLGPYYQQPFVAALEQAGFAPPALIARMKAERGTWSEDDLDRMRDYCIEECRHLARLGELLERQHAAVGLHPRRWHGPGSTAAAVLDKYKVRDCLAKPPAEVEQAADRAYFGGRFEQALIGRVEGCIAYDVRSAYPAAARTLPCLAHGRWVRQRKLPSESDVAVIRYRVRNIGDRVWGPLPCRLDDGSIVWPRKSHTGWAWSSEFFAAADGWRGVEFLKEAWVLRRNCSCEPFAFVDELYAYRTSKPELKQVVKLELNSVYGKLAQTAGGGSKYSSRVWAGLITADCRAKMLRLISRHADESHVCAIATDGCYSTEVHGVPCERLGEWEAHEEGAMTFLRPGIYWSPDKVRARGVGRKQLKAQLAEAERAIAERAPVVHLGVTTVFGGAREMVWKTPSGLYRRGRGYGEWFDVPSKLSLKPQPKRDADWQPPIVDNIDSRGYLDTPRSRDSKMLEVIGRILDARL